MPMQKVSLTLPCQLRLISFIFLFFTCLWKVFPPSLWGHFKTWCSKLFLYFIRSKPISHSKNIFAVSHHHGDELLQAWQRLTQSFCRIHDNSAFHHPGFIDFPAFNSQTIFCTSEKSLTSYRNNYTSSNIFSRFRAPFAIKTEGLNLK